MKRVKFKDGTYGIRRWTIWGYEYVDFKSYTRYWWGRKSRQFPDCKISNLDILNAAWDILTDKGEGL